MAVIGNLGDQEIQLENAAEEATLQRLVDLFDQKFADNSGVKKEEAQAIKEATKASNKSTTASKAYQDTVNNVSGSMEDFEKKVVSFQSVMTSASSAISSAGSNLTNSFKSLDESGANLGEGLSRLTGPSLGKLNDSAAGLGARFPKLGIAAQAASTGLMGVSFVTGLVLGAFDKSVEMFNTLTASGATFGGDMIAMRQASANAGTSMNNFTDAIKNNASGLSAFAGTSTQGAMLLSNVARAGKESSNELFRLGIAAKDQPEFFAQFISDLSTSGKSLADFGGDFNRVAAVSVKYRKDLQALQEITGQSREEQEAALKAQKNDAAFQGILAGMNVEQQESLKGLMAALSPLEQNLLKQQLTIGTFTGEAAVAAATLPGVAGRITDITNAIQGGNTDLLGAFAKSSQQRAQQLDADSKFADEQARRSAFMDDRLSKIVGGFATTLRIQNQQNRNAEDNLKEIRKSQEEEQALANAAASRAEAMQKINVALENIGTKLVDTKVVDKIVDVLETVANSLEGFANFFKDLSPSTIIYGGLTALFAGPAVMAAAAKGVTGLMATLATKAAGAAVRRVTGGGAAAAADLVPDSGRASPAQPSSAAQTSRAAPARPAPAQPGRAAPAQPSRAAGGAARGGRGGGALSRALSGLGRGAGAVISGIGNGLAALGPKAPMIALGAGAIATAIGLIGAAIAGATFLMGKAMPTLSAGIKSFEELDGDALIQAGKGMAAVSAGMAAFGAGSAVAGLGSLVGSITSGISSLFGGDDPLKQLATFSITPINAAGVKSNAEAMVAFSQAMAAAGGGTAAAGIGNLASNIASGISSFFGGDSPLEKVQKFGEQEINTAGVITNANALSIFAESMNKISSTGGNETAISDMSVGVRALSASLRNLDTTKLEALSEFMRVQAERVAVPELETQAQDPAEVGAPTTTDSETNITEMQSKTNMLLERLLDLHTKQLPEQTDVLARISRDF